MLVSKYIITIMPYLYSVSICVVYCILNIWTYVYNRQMLYAPIFSNFCTIKLYVCASNCDNVTSNIKVSINENYIFQPK